MLAIPALGDFARGVVVFCCTPCAVSSGVVMTAIAGGSVSMALMLTVVANLAGVFTTPVLLPLFMRSDSDITIDAVSMLINLILTILIPTIGGKVRSPTFVYTICMRNLRLKRGQYYIPMYVYRASEALKSHMCMWLVLTRADYRL